MLKELNKVDGVTIQCRPRENTRSRILKDFIPRDLMEKIESGGTEKIMVNSKYKAASDEVAEQLNRDNMQ